MKKKPLKNTVRVPASVKRLVESLGQVQEINNITQNIGEINRIISDTLVIQSNLLLDKQTNTVMSINGLKY